MLDVDLLVFDLDGTLLDTKKDIAFAVNEGLKEVGLAPASLEEITTYIGVGVIGLIRKLVELRSDTHFDIAIQKYYSVFATRLNFETVLYEGVIETLQSLPHPKVILTNKNERFTKATIDAFGLTKHFKAWYSRETFFLPKPSSVPCVEIAKRFGLPPERLAMIGDSPIDLIAGQLAGARSVAVTYGYSSRETLLGHSPDAVVEKSHELLTLFGTSRS